MKTSDLREKAQFVRKEVNNALRDICFHQPKPSRLEIPDGVWIRGTYVQVLNIGFRNLGYVRLIDGDLVYYTDLNLTEALDLLQAIEQEQDKTILHGDTPVFERDSIGVT